MTTRFPQVRSRVSSPPPRAVISLSIGTRGAARRGARTISTMLDLEATWNVNKILQIRAGANNVLDKNPPLVDSVLVGGGVANTYSLYDMFGRPNPRRRILP